MKAQKGAPASAAPAPVPPAELRPPSHIYRWDLDKTYLRTEFDTLRSLLRTAFESAEDKRTVPGAATLLRELRKPAPDGAVARVCFISGSPRQMRRVLTEKLRLDGIEFDEFILKNNLRNMLTGRFRAMREQVGYKLPALLSGRSGVPATTREVCFGDDAESDALIYSLYGDVLAGVVDLDLLRRILDSAGVYLDDAQRTVALAAALPRGEAVDRVLIHLDRRSPPGRFDKYGARLVPVYNYFQAALVLFQDGLLVARAVLQVALEMVDKHDYTLDALRNSLHDLLRRGRLQVETIRRLGELALEALPGDAAGLPALGEQPGARAAILRLAASLRQQEPIPGVPAPLPSDPIDYLRALESDLPRRKR